MRNYYIYFLLFYLKIAAQNLPLPQAIHAPNSANLGKYGDTPVSYYTGTPEVNIPLHTMEEKDVKLDISLSYDASGVRVNAVPSWIGQNWSLNAGGVITRTLQGLPDELSSPAGNYGSYYAAYGYFYPVSHTRLNVSNWTEKNFLQNLEFSNNGGGNPNADVNKDSQPDIFVFNFMGYTGKFFLSETGQWKVASSSNLKVNIEESYFAYPLGEQFTPGGPFRQSKMISKIELTDDNGITYTFGSDLFTINGAATEYSKDFFSQNSSYWLATAWYLTSVRNHLGQELYKLRYERDGFNANFSQVKYYKRTDAYYNDIIGGIIPTSANCGFAQFNSQNIEGTLFSPVYLKTIKSLSGKELTFNRALANNRFYEIGAPGPIYDRLVNIGTGQTGGAEFCSMFSYLKPYCALTPTTDTCHGACQLLKRFRWMYLVGISGDVNVTFQTNQQAYEGQHNERLNLKGVLVDGKGYSFEYDNFGSLPFLTSTAFDHMGYFDGSDYTTPNQNNFSSHFSQRATSATHVKYGSLKKINYPTKGFTEFIYEPHTYSSYLNDQKTALVFLSGNSIIGGLRIKQVKHYDGKGNVETKNYKYIKNYTSNPQGTSSSGILNALPKYYWDDWKVTAHPSNGYLVEKSFSINSIVPLSNYFGTHIGYTEVAEINEDGSYTLYKYTGNDEVMYRDESPSGTFNINSSPYEKCNDRSLLRGKLKETTFFNSNNIWVRKSIFTYSSVDTDLVKFVKSADVSAFACADLQYVGFLRGNAYKIYYFDNNLIKEETKNNLGGHEVRVSKSYTYIDYPILGILNCDSFLRNSSVDIYKNMYEPQSERIETSFTYPFDFSSAINTDLVNKRILAPLITTKSRNTDIIGKEETRYKYFNTSMLLPEKLLSAKGANDPEEEFIIDSYDYQGNVQQYHTRGGLYTTLIWGYKSKYPVVKIEGAQASPGYATMKGSEIESILNTSPNAWTNSHTQILAKLEDIRAYYSNYLVTTYTYAPFINNVKSITDPKGYTTFYDYDTSKRLISIKDADGNFLSGHSYHYKN